MFRNRKRKVSPDKKPDKSKKLKVSSKIFRSPSTTKTNSEAKSKLSKLLPEGYDSIILTANTKPVESFEENVAVFGCVRLPILTKEDAMVWVKKFERKTFTSYRTQRTWKKDVNTGLFKRKYICNVRNKDVPGQTTVATCKGSIIFTIKDQEEIQANPDYYLRDYPSQVIIHFCHNHKIDPDSYMKNLRPSAELRIIFGTYFAKGHSPFSALICHKCDLHSSYGADFYNVVSNGAICPSYNWCFHEYEKFFMRKFIEPPEDKLNEKLKDTVSQYNARWRAECAITSYNPLFVLSICTPLMKSIFRSGFAEELITVRCFSTPKTVPKRQKLILFLCHTPIGSLPFGVIVTFAEDTESICEGINALIKMFGVTTYNPKTIIIDENALLSKALKRCFPQAQVLFNEFQMLQSIWRIIRVVCTEDDEEFQALYNLFLVTLNSNSEEEFKKNFDSLLVYAEKYPKLTNFLKYFKVRSNSYVLYARPKIEFNTDVLNYTDSGTIILQDVSIKYGNFFNVVQLFDFLSKNYVDHYERKLNKIVDGDLKGFFKTNFYVPLSKIADFTCEKISDTEFLVSLNEMKFFVNAELDTCTCQVGVHGGSCVHQYIVEKNLGLVPECYTPLCDDMLGIFKNILKEKNIKPPLPDSDRLSELGSALDSLKSELETSQDPDDFSDIVSSVCCSEVSNFTGMPQDMDHLGPLDEIFLVPPDISDSFTDITDEAMSPLVLSEFDDTNEDNEDFFDDSQQYNRESGELEPIESSINSQETKSIQNTVLVGGFATNLRQSIPPTELLLTRDNTENVIIYEYTEDDIKCNNEVEIVEHGDTVQGGALMHLPRDGSVVVEEFDIPENIATDVNTSMVYTYSGVNQGRVFYENVMTENDRKTAEIAEFLTNLPGTNNSSNHSTTTKQGHISQRRDLVHSNKVNTAPYILERRKATGQGQTSSNGVVVVRNEEYFTNYNVLEKNLLSVVTKRTDTNPEIFEETSQNSAQDLITDTYEESNLIMMSPNDLFDDSRSVEPDMSADKPDGKINVLSSVVIKPPSFTQDFPLNLNAIKHKTLRNVKSSRVKVKERISQYKNTIFVHDPTKLSPRKIVLPIIIKKEPKNFSDLAGNKNVNVDKRNQAFEKDVIKLYCNQSGEKPVIEDNEQKESKMFLQELSSINKTPLEKYYREENLEKRAITIHAPKMTQSEEDSQEFNENLSDSEARVELTHSEGGSEEFDENLSDGEAGVEMTQSEQEEEDFEELSDEAGAQMTQSEDDFEELSDTEVDIRSEDDSQSFDEKLLDTDADARSTQSEDVCQEFEKELLDTEAAAQMRQSEDDPQEFDKKLLDTETTAQMRQAENAPQELDKKSLDTETTDQMRQSQDDSHEFHKKLPDTDADVQITRCEDGFQQFDEKLLNTESVQTMQTIEDCQVSNAKLLDTEADVRTAPSKDDSQEFVKKLSDTNAGVREYEDSSSIGVKLVEYDSKNDSQEINLDISGSKNIVPTYDDNVLDSQELMMTDYDHEELAKNNMVEIIEIDSDGLDELASQTFDPALMLSETPISPRPYRQKSSLKVKRVPSKGLPFKSFSESSGSLPNCMPLKDFMSRISSSKKACQQKSSSEETVSENTFTNKLLQRQVTNKESLQKAFLKENYNVQTCTDEKPYICHNEDSAKIKIPHVSNQIIKDNPKTAQRKSNNKHSKADCNATGLPYTHQLRQKISETGLGTSRNILNVDKTKCSENKEMLLNKNSKQLLGFNSKQTETIEDTHPLKESKGDFKTFGTTNEKVVGTSKVMDNSDSNEISSSESEYLSDSFGSISSGIDQLSEDELYELQYLWDDSSDESIDDVDPSSSIPLNKSGVKTLKKTDLSNISPIVKTPRKTEVSNISPIPQSTENSTNKSINRISSSSTANKHLLHLNLPPGIRIVPMEMTRKKVIGNSSTKPVNKTSPKEHVLKNLPPNRSLKSTSTDSFLGPDKLITKSKNPQSRDGSAGNTFKGKVQLPEKPKLKVNKPSATKSREAKKIISKPLSKSNRVENANKSGCLSSDSGKVSITSHIGSNNKNVDKQQLSNKKVEKIRASKKTAERNLHIHTKSIDNVNQPDTSLKMTDQNLALAKRADNRIRSDQKVENDITSTPHKTNQKVDPKRFNVKNKLLNTSLKLDSLPSILSRPYNLRATRSMNFNITNSGVLPKNEPIDDSTPLVNYSSGNTSKTADDNVKVIANKKKTKQSDSKSGILQDTKNQNLSLSLPVKTPVVSCRSSNISPKSPYIPATLHAPYTKRIPLQKEKDIEDLEAILTSDKDIERDSYSYADKKDTKNNSYAESILQNNDLSFLFDDPRFETVVEEETLPPVSPIDGQSAAQMKNPLRENRVSKNENSNKQSINKKYDDIQNVRDSASSIKAESPCKEMAQHIKNTSLTERGVQSKDSKTRKSTKRIKTSTISGLIEPGQDNTVSILFYPNVSTTTPTRKKPKKKIVPDMSKFRKILPKPEASSAENNTDDTTVGENSTMPKIDTSNQNVNKENLSLNETRGSDLNQSNTIAGSIENFQEIENVVIVPDIGAFNLIRPQHKDRGEVRLTKEESVKSRSRYREASNLNTTPINKKQKPPNSEFLICDSDERQGSAKSDKMNKHSTRQSRSNLSMARSSLNYESDDFENSIAASILKKQRCQNKNLTPVGTKKERPLISSTPRKSIGYEDAFKIFLESSSRLRSNKEYGKPLSDSEKYIDGSNRESKRRSKSVSSPKEEINNKKLSSETEKKAVSCGEGLNVIEYINESDTDSDSSEIIDVSKKNKFTRENRKKPSTTFLNHLDQPRSKSGRWVKQDKATQSRSQNVNARVGGSNTDEDQINRSVSSSSDFHRSRSSLTRTDDLSTIGYRSTRPSSKPFKRENPKNITNSCARRYTRVDNLKAKLIVLLQRNKHIDQMCLSLGNQITRASRSRGRMRIGYKELLHRAKLSKYLD